MALQNRDHRNNLSKSAKILKIILELHKSAPFLVKTSRCLEMSPSSVQIIVNQNKQPENIHRTVKEGTAKQMERHWEYAEAGKESVIIHSKATTALTEPEMPHREE